MARCRAAIMLAIAAAVLLGVVAQSTSPATGADGFLSPSLLASALLTPADLGGQYVRSQQSMGQAGSLVGLGAVYLAPLVNGGVTQADAFFVPANTPPSGLDEIQITLAGFRSSTDATAFLNYLTGNVRSQFGPAPAVASDPRTLVVTMSQDGVLEVRIIARQGNVVLGVKATASPPNSAMDPALEIAREQARKIDAAASGSISSPTPATAASPTASATAATQTPAATASATTTPPASATPTPSPTTTPTLTPPPTAIPTATPTVVPTVTTPTPTAQPTPTDVDGTDEDPPQPRL